MNVYFLNNTYKLLFIRFYLNYYYKILRNFKINKYSNYIELIYYDKSDQ